MAGQKEEVKHAPCRELGCRQRESDTSQCKLCTRLRESQNRLEDRTKHRQPLWLRILLVGGDGEVRAAVVQAVQAHSDGWTLEICHPCCPAQDRPRGRPALSHAAPKADRAPDFLPDIVLVMVGKSSPDRLACMRKIKTLRPELPVVSVCGPGEEVPILQCLMAGADGCLLKSVDPEALGQAISSVVKGGPALCLEAQKTLMLLAQRVGTSLWSERLSRREQEIICCLAAKLSDKEIGDRLDMTRNTVHVHLARLYRKLGVHTRAQALSKSLGRAMG